MSQFGWGVAATLASDEDRPFLSGMRWDVPGTQWYHFRPDRVLAQLRGGADIALLPILASRELRGVGGPSVTTPTSTVPSNRRQGRASAEPGQYGGPRQVTQRGGRARRKECPKGHYWSYKKKKCVKSKFR